MIRRLALLFTALSLVSCMRLGRTPHSGLFPPIVQAYHRCSGCRSLHGGIYGKGPTLYLKAQGADSCPHAWELISRETFQQSGERDFPDQWAKAGLYFKQTPPDEIQSK